MISHKIGAWLRVIAFAAVFIGLIGLYYDQRSSDADSRQRDLQTQKLALKSQQEQARAGCIRSTTVRWEEVLVLRASAKANEIVSKDPRESAVSRRARAVEAEAQRRAARIVAATTRPTAHQRRAFCDKAFS